MLLRRVGVANRCYRQLRDECADDSEFVFRLKVARDAALLSGAVAWGEQDRANAQLADSAAALAAQLSLAFELAESDPKTAERCVERVGDQMVSLLMVDGSQHTPVEEKSDEIPVTRRTWWASVRARMVPNVPAWSPG